MRFFIDLVERGLLPDTVTRAGIRRLLEPRAEARANQSPSSSRALASGE